MQEELLARSGGEGVEELLALLEVEDVKERFGLAEGGVAGEQRGPVGGTQQHG